MSSPRWVPLALASQLVLGGFVFSPSAVRAQVPDAARLKEAGSHFERGVSLYKEADYRGALVEFRRAYEIAPNATVRFNLGQAQYQLRDYPGALTTFEAYLAEAPAGAPNRAEAEAAVAQLRLRVGVLRITGPAGAEVWLQDESIGRLPLAPLPVPVGPHKVLVVTASGGRQARSVDVVGGATVEVTFAAMDPGGGNTLPPVPAAAPPSSAPPPAAPSSSATELPRESDGRGWRTGAWVLTGVFVAGAVTTGLVARSASSKLTDLKKQNGVSLDDLDRYHGRMRTFAVMSDVLSGIALVTGGAALYFTFSPSKTTALQVGPGSLSLRGSFLRMPRRLTLPLVLLLALGVPLLGACSLVLNQDKLQCSTDGDCAAVGAGLVCRGGLCGAAATATGTDSAPCAQPAATCPGNVCFPFDNCARLGLCAGSSLPALVAPPTP